MPRTVAGRTGGLAGLNLKIVRIVDPAVVRPGDDAPDQGAQLLTHRLLLTAVSLLSTLGLATGVARAAPTGYTMQIGSRSAKNAVVLDGDQITGFQATVAPTSCAAGDPRNSADSTWEVNLTAPVSLDGGSFQFSGTAPSSYDAGTNLSYSGAYAVSGSLTPDHRIMTGTITLSNASDGFLSGCTASLHFTAIPTVTQTRGPANSRATFQSQFVSFNARSGVISSLRLQANFQCGDSIDSASVWSSDYRFGPIHTTRSGRWELTSYVLDEYGNIVALRMSGRLSGRRAGGRIQISEPPGLSFINQDACRANYGWSASRPRPPAPPGPQAFFTWNAVRVPAGASYRYYFYISGLTCTDRATAVQLTVARRRTTILCRHHAGWASGPLAPGRTYASSARAVELRGHRAVKRGVPVSEPIVMPGAGDRWRPIPRLPGHAPA